MRIAFLCKRYYMSHDVIVDRYARLYEQPKQLALRGHEVLGVCLSYRNSDEPRETHITTPGQLRWAGLSPGAVIPFGAATFPMRALTLLRAYEPDLIVGASDAPHVVLGSWLADRLRTPYAVDLYDHFASFGLSRIPGLVALYRRAVRRAAVITCVSEPLAELVKIGYRARGDVFALPSTIDKGIFRPLDRQACRRSLGLPEQAKLVGTAGGLSRDKGIEPLYRAFEQLAGRFPDLHLVLAGPLDPRCPPPPGPRVHHLGLLPHARVPELFAALDVGVVYLRDTPYGRYSFPQKAYEMAACQLPVVAARIGAMATLFAPTPAALYGADDPRELAQAIAAQLLRPQIPSFPIPDWADLALPMERAYLRCLA